MVATNVTCAVAEALRCATSQVTVADRVGRVTVYVEAPHSTAADLDAAERAASAMVPMGVVVRVRRSQMPAARAFAVAHNRLCQLDGDGGDRRAQREIIVTCGNG